MDYDSVYAWVRKIPSGKVATYGQLATYVGCTARQVGYAMANTPTDEGIPWHRVVNSQGKVSVRSEGGPDPRQTVLLKAEGVIFKANSALDLDQYQYSFPPDAEDWMEPPDVPGLG